MERVENVATPATAATVVVPDSAPPPGLVPMATVTWAVQLLYATLFRSCTGTCTAGAIATPATALLGCTENASLEAAAGAMLKPALEAPVSGAEAAVSV